MDGLGVGLKDQGVGAVEDRKGFGIDELASTEDGGIGLAVGVVAGFAQSFEFGVVLEVEATGRAEDFAINLLAKLARKRE